MKYLAWVVGLILLLVIALYVVAFTPVGNSLLKPIIEAKIQEQTKVESKLNTFLLSMSDFEVVLELAKDNLVIAKGSYSIFAKSFDINYEIDFKNLKSLEPILNMPLNGSFNTDGAVKGDLAFMTIDGKSSVGQSDTSYHVELSDLNPTSIIANMKNAKLSSLLYMGAKNPYAVADINLDINLKNITPHKLDGEIKLSTKNGVINPEFMKSDFNVTVPKTSFDMNLDAKLNGDDVVYNYDLVSNLFKISSSGALTPEPFKADVKYALDVKDLEVLKPISGADIRGALKLNGTLSGDKSKLVVRANSDVASSQTTIEAILKDFAPESLRAKIVNLDVSKLLYMVKQPHYADALLSLEADISDARVDSLKGEVKSSITNGVFDSAYLSKAYEFSSPMPRSTFSAKTTTVLKDSMADTKVNFNSNLANLDIKSAKFNIKDGSLKSDYMISVNELNNLYFVTGEHMRGGFVGNGELSKAEDLDFALHSNISGGVLDAKLHNDDFSANISDVKTMKLLYMLMRPELVDATLNAKVNYNLAQSKGEVNGDILNAVFTKNQTFDLIKQFTKVDMYRENFNGKVGAKINKENILASLDMRSKETALTTKDAKLNTKTNQMNSDLTIVIKNDTIHANLNGDINSPKVSIDLEKFLKSETGKKVIEKVDKLFKKLF
ncbi:MAG: hypothetical protein WC274_05565 [Sulfurimonas sp.]|jgi:hypothetical protein